MQLTLQDRLRLLELDSPNVMDKFNKKDSFVVYGYTRVSTMKQCNDGISLDVQNDYITRYCTENSLREPVIVQERGKSAKTMDRDELNDIISKLKPGDTFVVYSSSRLARTLKGFLDFLDDMNTKKVTVALLKDGITIYPGVKLTPSEIVNIQISGCFAEYENNILSDRTKDAMQRLAADGLLNTKPYFGQKRVSDPDNEGETKLVDISEHQEIIQFILKQLVIAKTDRRFLNIAEITRRVNSELDACRLVHIYKPKLKTNGTMTNGHFCSTQIRKIIDQQGFFEMLESLRKNKNL